MGMWLVSLALAAPGLELPPGEDPARWRSAARLAGIEVGCASTSTCVTVEAGATGWALRVGARRGSISAPVDQAGRAAVAWLAASLAQPLPTVAVAPPPRPRPPRVKPRTEPPEPIPEAPVPPPAEVVVEPEPVAMPVVPPPPATALPSPASPRVVVELRVAGGAVLQQEVAPAAVGGGSAAVASGRWAAELGAEVSTAASLVPSAPTWTQARVDVLGGVCFAPLPWLTVGMGGGASRRSWAEAGRLAATTWLPVVHTVVEARVPGEVVDVVVRVRPALDLRGVELARGGSPVGSLGRASVSAGVGLLVRLGG